MRTLTHSIEIQEKGGMCLRRESADEEKFVFVVPSVIIIPTRDFILHPRLGVLHEGVEAITTLFLWYLAETVQV